MHDICGAEPDYHVKNRETANNEYNNNNQVQKHAKKKKKKMKNPDTYIMRAAVGKAPVS